MARYSVQDLRNVALLGHNSSGKTTLADALLFKAGAVPRQGKIEDGTSIFDTEPEEKARGVTIDLHVAPLTYQGREVNLLDAPGYYDFCGEASSALAAVETAILCVNAQSGIMVNTRKMWQAAKDAGVCRAIVLTKLDLDNIDLPALLANLRESFGPECVPLYLPSGTGPHLERIVSVVGADIPPSIATLCHDAREKLMEVDDALLERYLEGQAVAAAEIEKALPGAVLSGKLVPILAASVARELGLPEILDFIAKVLPSPDAYWKARGGERFAAAGRTDGAAVGQVFKSVSDPFVGRLAYIKVFAGRFAKEKPLFNKRTGKSGRIGELFRPFGKDQRPAPEAILGEIVGVTKVEDLSPGDTVCQPEDAAVFPPLRFPTPMVSLAVEPKSREHEQRLTTTLQKMADSDPTFKVSRDAQTAELVITGMSQLHLEVALERMKRRYQVEVVTKTPKIPYKETVLAKAEGHHKHKKQTGGHGQYGEVYLQIEPLARGSGYDFANEVVGGRIPTQYIPAVDKGVRETVERGVIAGYPVVDVRVTVTDGSYHDVDSSPESFKLAGSKAFKKAFQDARPVLLEPVVNLEVAVPSKFMGDITGHVNQKRGRIMGIESQGDSQTIKALIPLSEVMNYAADLRSMTGGEGFYTMEFSHYDVLPARLTEAIVARSKREEEEE